MCMKVVLSTGIRYDNEWQAGSWTLVLCYSFLENSFHFSVLQALLLSTSSWTRERWFMWQFNALDTFGDLSKMYNQVVPLFWCCLQLAVVAFCPYVSFKCTKKFGFLWNCSLDTKSDIFSKMRKKVELLSAPEKYCDMAIVS